jgi:hypothetical protein
MLTSLTLGYFAASTGSKSVVRDVPEAAVNEPAPENKAPEGATAPADKAAQPEAPAGNEAAPKANDAAGSQGQKTDDSGQKKAQ